MGGISRSTVFLASLLLAASAVLGLYLGYSRASAAPGGAAGDQDYSTAAATIAPKTAAPIPDSAPPAPVPDEAFIRKIAREEVQAAAHPHRSAPAADNDDSDSSDDTDATPDAAGATPPPAAANTPPPSPPPP